MCLHKITLDQGREFIFDNTTSGELLVSITTVAGSVIEFRLAPGGRIRVTRVFENLKVDARPGTAPGISPADTPEPESGA